MCLKIDHLGWSLPLATARPCILEAHHMSDQPSKIDSQSLDIEQADRNKLQSLFPQCFSEGKLDIDKLLNLCGEYIDESHEKYKFEWKGKAESYRHSGKRSNGTLRPAPAESVDFGTTENLYIEGGNLEVLKLLQKATTARSR